MPAGAAADDDHGALAEWSARGSVYKDDRAPVEWLTDLSILRYATGAR
jgi:hypothetical protein